MAASSPVCAQIKFGASGLFPNVAQHARSRSSMSATLIALALKAQEHLCSSLLYRLSIPVSQRQPPPEVPVAHNTPRVGYIERSP
eukprot:1767724-Pleurochrysis_carterae.AAC.9